MGDGKLLISMTVSGIDDRIRFYSLRLSSTTRTRPDRRGPARTLSETRTDPTEFLGDPGRKKVRAGLVGSGRAGVVEFRYKILQFTSWMTKMVPCPTSKSVWSTVMASVCRRDSPRFSTSINIVSAFGAPSSITTEPCATTTRQFMGVRA